MFRQATRNQIRLRATIDGPSGSGKAQPLDAMILTPTGWKEMGQMRIGDTIVDPDGGIGKVVGIFPRGEMDVFRITFSDGSSTRCTADHLWLTRTVLDRAVIFADGRKRVGVRTTADIAQSITYKNKRNHTIPLTKPVDLGDGTPLPLDPYLLGALLGNACFQDKFVTFSSADAELIADVAQRLPEGVHVQPQGNTCDYGLRRDAASGPNVLLAILREFGLDGCRSVDKFVPPAYLWTSAANRLALLQGLMDTDGYANGCTAEYATSSRQLALDMQFLVRSLGGTCSLSERIPAYTHNGEKRIGHLSYRMNLCMPGDVPPFRCTRKAQRYKPRTKYQPRRFIESIVFEARQPVQCIGTTCKRSLYVTDDWVVTHNTYTALRFAFALAQYRLAHGGSGKVALIDTEHESASKYVGESPDGFPWAFDTAPLVDFAPDRYTDLINQASRAGYSVLVIDSLSHAWEGTGGALDLKDKVGANQSNQYTAWRSVTPLHNRMIEAILQANCDVITTMRSRQEYVQDTDDRGKIVGIRRVGMAPVQRSGTEYEFDIVCDMDWDHILTVGKTRCPAIDGLKVQKPGPAFMTPVIEWLATGTPHETPTFAPPPFTQQKASAPVAPQVQTASHDLMTLLDKYGADMVMAANGGKVPATDSEVESAWALLGQVA